MKMLDTSPRVRTERSPSAASPREDWRSEGRTKTESSWLALEEGQPRVRQIQTWFEEEEPTAEIWLLGSLLYGPPVVLELDAPLSAARALFLERRCAAIVVVDGNRLLGVITRTDVLRDATKHPEPTVADAMSGFVIAMPADSSIEAAAALMATEQVGQVVVTNARGELAGIVSAVDIARHVARKAGYIT